MIQPAQHDQYSHLLDLQIECIRRLDGTYSQQEIDAWIGYLVVATPERFEAFQNAIWTDNTGSIDGFVSWSENPQTKSAAIECLYVREATRGQGIGRLLLAHAEQAITSSKIIEVRSTLNAQKFYERNGYSLQEHAISRAGFAIAKLQKSC